MKVSFQVAKMWQTAKRSPETFWGPRLTTAFCSSLSSSLVFSCFSAGFSALTAAGLSTFSGLSALGYLVAGGAGFATSAING